MLRLLSTAAALLLASRVRAVEIQTETLEHGFDGHVEGFTLSSVYSIREGEAVEHVLPVSDHLRRKVRTLNFPTFDPRAASKTRTMTLAKLSLVTAYVDFNNPTGSPVPLGPHMEALMQETGGFFQSSNVSQEIAAARAFRAEVLEELGVQSAADCTPAGCPLPRAVVPGEGNSFALPANVVAYGWTSSDGNNRVLVFRGTQGLQDQLYALSLTAPFALSRMQQKMRQAWEESGLEWSGLQQANEARNASMDMRLLSLQGLLVLGSQGATLDPIFQTTVFQIAGVEAALAQSRGWGLTFTGHSQGGLRAAMSSMFLKKRGATVPAVTFASTGAGCTAHRNAVGAWISNDIIDTSDAHEQLTEYVHPLDPYGNGLGRDIGKECRIGTHDRNNLDVAKRVCDSVFGHHGAYLLRIELQYGLYRAAQLGVVSIPEEMAPVFAELNRPLDPADQQLLAAWDRCRYMTHFSYGMYQRLEQELQDNGDTASGCVMNPPLPRADPLCPFNASPEPEDDDDFVGSPGFIGFIVVGCVAIVALIFFVVRCALSSNTEGEVGEPEKTKNLEATPEEQ